MNTFTGSSILSVPSWVIPGTYAENLRFLANKKEIEGVELLFFLYDEQVHNELNSEWNEILSFRERFVFTAHLPDPLLPVHEELIARLSPIVRHFIVHPDVKDPAAQAGLLSDWKARYGSLFLAENTKPGHLEALLPYLEPSAGLCLDTGHLILNHQNPVDFFTAHRERVGELHLHGVNPGQAAIDKRLADHRPLFGNEQWLRGLLPLLRDFSGIINLEMFSWEEIEATIHNVVLTNPK
jgi:hypothetical protein